MKTSSVRGKPAHGDGAPRWRFARFVRATVGRLILAAYRVDIRGAENVPAGGAIIAGNHVSYLDPVLLWCLWPGPIHFVAKAELWRIPLIGLALDHLWVIPVRRGTADREMIQTASALLASAEVLGMFPEGTRKRDTREAELGEAHGGVSFLALRNDAPIVPVGIAGTDEALPAGAWLPRFPRVHVRIGEPVLPAAFEGGRKERMEAMTTQLMLRIARMRDEAREARRS